jgi:adenylosuccinate lyase
MGKIWSETNKYDLWLKVELAACEAWAEEGVIPNADMVLLRRSKYDYERLTEIFEDTRHDMTAFTRSITENLGQEGRWIHLGLTSSDVMDTALGLQMVEAARLLDEGLSGLIDVIKSRAIEFKKTPMMGRTHGVHAEPITFGLKLALWWSEMMRQRKRLALATEDISVGKLSGAVGSYATLSPTIEERTCARLGLTPAPVSNQIIQRDRHAFFLTTLALIAASLEKFATEIRHLQRTEVREVQEAFSHGQTGSSAMPHKRNPELSERVCGLARLIRGNALVSLENVALWHERDISHSSAERVIIPDSCIALDYILALFTGVIQGLRVYPDRMITNIEATRGLVFSQRVLIALVERGISREESYDIVQGNASRSWEDASDFRELLRKDIRVSGILGTDELDGLFDYAYYSRFADETFRRLGLGE